MCHLRLPALVLALTLSSTAAALQWSGDAASNLAVADQASEEVQPKIAARTDGGCYVSWYDSDPAGSPAFGFDVKLQSLDAEGNELWAAGGILIADRGFSSTQNYDLAVDAAGNALLTFRDDRFTGIQITATLVEPDGTQAWGATGVQLTNTGSFVSIPKITGTSDGDSVVAWGQGSELRVQRLSPAGIAQWASDVVLTPAAGVSFSPSGLHAGDSGSAIVGMTLETGGFGAPRHLYAQKLDASGALLWGAGHLPIFTAGSLQFGNFPDFVPDGSGGAVFGWYTSSPALECRAQRVRANGAPLFPANGVAASTDATLLRVSPAVAFDPASQQTLLAYTELISNQSQSGISAQKYDATGNRLWGATGQTVQAISPDETGEANVQVDGAGGALVFWTSAPGFGQDVVLGARLDGSGATTVGPFDVSSTPATKFRLESTRTPDGTALLAWQDDGSGSADVLVQNADPDGTLGNLLSVDVEQISVSAGGSQVLALNAGPANASTLYWTIGSATGTSPGIPGPPEVPLVFDAYTLFLITYPNLFVLNSLNVLDGSGEGLALISLGPGDLDGSFVGLSLFHAYVLLDGSLTPTLASNAVSLTFAP